MLLTHAEFAEKEVAYCGGSLPTSAPIEANRMVDRAALADIEKRIQIIEDNLRELIEQAAAYSGAADEERNADRIADQQAKLDALLKEREALLARG
jgi:hypothetical protein